MSITELVNKKTSFLDKLMMAKKYQVTTTCGSNKKLEEFESVPEACSQVLDNVKELLEFWLEQNGDKPLTVTVQVPGSFDITVQMPSAAKFMPKT